MNKELEKITEKDFISYVNKVRNDDITTVAPLGFSSDDFIIYETKNKPLRKEFITKEEYEKLEETGYFGKEGYNKPVCRSSQLSFRKYGSHCELLITDYEGNFLIYSQLNFAFSDEYIGKYFYNTFIDLKPYMNTCIDKVEQDINFAKVNLSTGFDILKGYLKNELEKDTIEKEV